MPSATPRDPSAGRRAGAAKARAHKATRQRNTGATITRIGAAVLPEGEKAPPLSNDELMQFHPTCIALYQSLGESEEAAHFRRTDWFSVKLVLLVVSGHLNDMSGYLRAVEDERAPGGYRVVEVPAHVKVGVLNEIRTALDGIHATPAGRTNYALALAALAKAMQDDAAEELERQRQREVSAEAAVAVMFEKLASMPAPQPVPPPVALDDAG